jgi:hypothetical protein
MGALSRGRHMRFNAKKGARLIVGEELCADRIAAFMLGRGGEPFPRARDGNAASELPGISVTPGQLGKEVNALTTG